MLRPEHRRTPRGEVFPSLSLFLLDCLSPGAPIGELGEHSFVELLLPRLAPHIFPNYVETSALTPRATETVAAGRSEPSRGFPLKGTAAKHFSLTE